MSTDENTQEEDIVDLREDSLPYPVQCTDIGDNHATPAECNGEQV